LSVVGAGGPESAIVPKKLGPYLIGRRLGAGGMAQVFAARQEASHIKRLVALKLLSAAVSKDDPEHKSFMREALLATRLEHPNIVRTYDVGEVDGVMYLAMELVHGAPLHAAIRAEKGPTPFPIALRIASDVARALHAAHELVDPERGHLGVVHQDVSPQNVLIGYDGIVKLVDFGVARFGSIEGSKTESLKGKPSYVSPEQIAGKNIDRRTDVFALGVITWELLTGERLFKRETSPATYLAVLQDPIKPPHAVNPKVPVEISTVVMHALEREKDKRFETAEDMRANLASARDRLGIPEASTDQLAAWVKNLVKPTLAPTDLEREIVKEAANAIPLPVNGVRVGSSPNLEDAAAAAGIGVPKAFANEEVPDLDLGMPAPRKGPPPAPRAPLPNPDAPTVTPPRSTSQAGMAAVRIPSSPALPQVGGIALSSMDDDDFGDGIERGPSMLGGTQSLAMQSSPSSRNLRTTGDRGPRGASAVPIATSGLDIAATERTEGLRRIREREDDEPSTITIIASWILAAAFTGGAAFGLFKVAHRPKGVSLTSLLPHAFDGTSIGLAGFVAISTLIGAVAIGFLGVKVRPRSAGFILAAVGFMLTALAMVTVALGSSPENPTPPDGALLIPYLLPLGVLGIGLGLGGRAAAAFRSPSIAKKLAVLPLGAIGGALAFAAFELFSGR
jgi:serine/threonine-protein kinase